MGASDGDHVRAPHYARTALERTREPISVVALPVRVPERATRASDSSERHEHENATPCVGRMTQPGEAVAMLGARCTLVPSAEPSIRYGHARAGRDLDC